MSRSERIPPARAQLKPGERVLVRVCSKRRRVAGTVVEVLQPWLYGVRLQDGREVVRLHSELRKSGFQP